MFRNLWLLSLVAFCLPSIVRAGPLEQLVQVAANETRVVVRYDGAGGGYLLSGDGGETFALLCSAAIDDALGVQTMLLRADDALLVASFDGLVSDDGTGCGFARDEGLAGRWVSDLAPDPSDPDVTFAITSQAEPQENGIYRRLGGGPFTRFGRFDTARPTRLRVAEREPGQLRFYQSILRGTRTVDLGAGPVQVASYAIRYSDDGAVHWTEHGFEASTGSVRLEAVDPTDADRIVVSVTNRVTDTTLLVSDDAGATFRSYLKLVTLGGLAITPEGRVFIGDAGDLSKPMAPRGLYRAENLNEPPQQWSDAYAVTCLGYRPADATLFACSRYVFGSVEADGSLRPRLKLTEVEALVECPDRDVRALCRDPLLRGYCGTTHFPCAPMCDPYQVDLADLASYAASDESVAACLERRGEAKAPQPEPDAGPTRQAVAGPPPPPAPPASRHAAYGCNATGSNGTGPMPAFAGVVLYLFERSRRRARRTAREA